MLTNVVLSLLPLVVLANEKECINLRDYVNEDEKCCSMPLGLPEESFGACVKSAEQQVPDKNMDSLLDCAYECYFKGLGIVTGTTVQMDKIKKYMEKLEGNARILNILAWEACDQSKSTLLKAVKWQTHKCNTFPRKMQDCVELVIDRNCPPNHFDDKREICRKLRSGLPPCYATDQNRS
ncbi:general odorant-binding protein 68-like [Uranotaenia lowii]|uniref:general odorant-binding protein 68-like n=1 Tax=Uranotaenia lowii TaxID=190385 RepID=UPI00247A03C8|nr:general odorant-binding protein 68-like [Uranotaenia lowii]